MIHSKQHKPNWPERIDLSPYWNGERRASRICRQNIFKIILFYLLSDQRDIIENARVELNRQHIGRYDSGGSNVPRSSKRAYGSIMCSKRHLKAPYINEGMLDKPFCVKLKTRRDHGIIAGLVLILVYAIHRAHGPRIASIGRAFEVIQEYPDQNNGYGPAGKKILSAVSKTRLPYIWSEMKPVAHLWAAFIITDLVEHLGEAGYAPGHNRLQKFICIASRLEEFARTFTPYRANKAILSGNIVSIPDDMEFVDGDYFNPSIDADVEGILELYWRGNSEARDLPDKYR